MELILVTILMYCNSATGNQTGNHLIGAAWVGKIQYDYVIIFKSDTYDSMKQFETVWKFIQRSGSAPSSAQSKPSTPPLYS